MPDPKPASRPALASQPWVWLSVAAVAVAIDYLSGPTIEFPLFYLLPISLAAWHGARRWGVALAVALPLIRLGLRAVWHTPWSMAESLVNAGIRMTVFVGFALLIYRVAKQMRELRHLHLLEGMTGVCHTCKKIKDGNHGTWQSLDAYLAGRPGQFESDLCPECSKQAGEMYDRR